MGISPEYAEPVLAGDQGEKGSCMKCGKYSHARNRMVMMRANQKPPMIVDSMLKIGRQANI
jgi:hypothetical protein